MAITSYPKRLFCPPTVRYDSLLWLFMVSGVIAQTHPPPPVFGAIAQMDQEKKILFSFSLIYVSFINV